MKYPIILLLLLVCIYSPTFAQRENQNTELEARKIFINKIDSLFVHKQYETIIEECNKVQPYYNQSTADYNLIATYYFIGDFGKSKELLDFKVKSKNDVLTLTDILFGDYTSYRYFIEVPENKKYLLEKIYNKQNEEPISDKKNAKSLLTLLIADQYTRHMSKMYTKSLSKTKFPYEFLKSDSITNVEKNKITTDIFEFYTRTGKFFSENEVGSIYYFQFLFLLHEGNLKRREFYLDLIKKAVKEGVFPLKREIEFQIGTELIQKDLPMIPSVPTEILEKYRKIYNLPEYNYFPF